MILLNSPKRLERRTPVIEVIMFGGGLGHECESFNNVSCIYTINSNETIEICRPD